mgnify:CR=1 FL=1
MINITFKCLAFCTFLSIAVGNIFLVILTLYFFTKCYQKQIKFNTNFKDYFVVIGIFLISMFVSALFSGDIIYGLKRWTDMWIWRFMPFVIVIFLLNKYVDAKKVMIAGFVGITVTSLYAVYQGLSGISRANGFYGHPMTLGGWLCIFMPLLLIEFFEKRLLDKYYWLSGIAFCVCSAGLVFNGTRGAWLAVAIVCAGLIIYYMFKSKSNLAVGIIFIALISALLVNNSKFMHRLDTIDDFTKYQSNTERILIWQSAWNMFKDHPILGVGLGQYTVNYQQKYISPQAKEPNLGHAHNNFMQMLAENGIVGFAGFIVMFGYIILKNSIEWIKTKNVYALMIIASTVCLILQGFTEYNVGNSAVIKMYWLILGLLVILDSCYKTYNN